ncbi:MAG TPA: hypothetical protein P5069_05505 [Candidatus Hydrogenedentes bacterium]|nr:hypothetical protein [Candidatus Hydrogenedentota bacterium]
MFGANNEEVHGVFACIQPEFAPVEELAIYRPDNPSAKLLGVLDASTVIEYSPTAEMFRPVAGSMPEKAAICGVRMLSPCAL